MPTPSPSLNILNGHILKNSRFAHAGLADNIHVLCAVVALYAKTSPLAAKISLGKIIDVVIAVSIFSVDAQIPAATVNIIFYFFCHKSY